MLPTRLLKIDGAHNIRDLGGYPITGGATTRWRSVLRADGLSGLDPDACGTLLREGVTTIVDLRGEHEIGQQPSPFCTQERLHYCNISLFSALAPVQALTLSAADFDMSARYRQALDDCGPAIRNVMQAIADAGPGMVLFHCTAGKDRTGIIAALLLRLAGVERRSIVEDYALTAQVAAPLLANIRRRYLGRGVAPEHVEQFLACAPQTMESLLDHLDRTHGGVETYLRAIGLGNDTICRLRARLL